MTKIPEPDRIYIDSNIFIFFLEAPAEKSEPIKSLFENLRTRRALGVTSELTLAEVLAGPSEHRNSLLERAYLDLIVFSGLLELWPVSRDVLYDSVRLRAIHKTAHNKKLKLADAIHLVSAIQTNCKFFLSDDRQIFPPKDIKRISSDPASLQELLSLFP